MSDIEKMVADKNNYVLGFMKYDKGELKFYPEKPSYNEEEIRIILKGFRQIEEE